MIAIPDGWFLRDGEPQVTWLWMVETLIACECRLRIFGPLCDTHDCLALAEFRTFWPSDNPNGQAKCPLCATRLNAVASAMGFVLPVQHIDVPADVRMLMLADHREAMRREAARMQRELADDPTAARFAAMELD